MSRMDRRSFLARLSRAGIGAAALGALPPWARAAVGAAAAPGSDDLIVRNDRPENFETTLEALGQTWITRSDRFFVRSHLSTPTSTPRPGGSR